MFLRNEINVPIGTKAYESTKDIALDPNFRKMRALYEYLSDLSESNIYMAVDYVKNNFMSNDDDIHNFLIDLFNISAFHYENIENYKKLFYEIDKIFNITEVHANVFESSLNIIKFMHEQNFNILELLSIHYMKSFISSVDKNRIYSNFENKQTNNEKEIYYTIENDDVQELNRIVTNPNFYNRNNNILSFAALMGSINCFKYLILNNFPISKDTMKCAVSGGNMTIIQILEQKGFTVEESNIEMAIKFHRVEIFDWILETQDIGVSYYELCVENRFWPGIEKYESFNIWKMVAAAFFGYFIPAFSYCLNLNEFDISTKKCFKMNFRDRGCKIPNDMVETIIVQECKRKSTRFVEILLNKFRNKIQYNYIYLAVKHDNVETLKLFLSDFDMKMLVSSKEHNESEILFSDVFTLSCMFNCKKVIDYLINTAKVELNGNIGCCPLYYLCKNGDIDRVKLLLTDKSVDINKLDRNSDECCLTTAIAYEHRDIVRLLLDQQNIIINPIKGVSPLSAACAIGDIALVKELLLIPNIDVNGKYNCCPESPYCYRNWKAYFFYTPLISAIENNHLEIFKLLIKQKGIDINKRESKSPLEAACSDPLRGYEMAKILLDNPEIEVNGDKNHSPLHSLLQCRIRPKPDKAPIHELAKILISHPKIDLNKKIKIRLNSRSLERDVSILDLAIDEFPETALLMLDNPRLRVRPQDHNLSKACEKGHLKIVEKLLTFPNIDVNGYKNDGMPLLNACAYNQVDIVKLLLSNPNINVNISNLVKTPRPAKAVLAHPLELAIDLGYDEIIEELLKHPSIDRIYFKKKRK